MRRYVFLDLDDTLFQVSRKCPEGEPVEPISYSILGQPVSFITDRQRELFRWLGDEAEIIPTTARSIDGYRRVKLFFPGYAICSFGGIVLMPDGSSDPTWLTHIVPLAEKYADNLAIVARELKEYAERRELDVRISIISDAGSDFYVSVKHNQANLSDLKIIADFMQHSSPANWHIHLNDNNLALLPPYLGKEHAVSWFIERYINVKESIIIGVGDSFTDANFMALCDYALTPTKSQFFNSFFKEKL